MDVVQDGEEPGAQIAAGPPEMSARQRAREAVLHQIIGVAGIAEQSAGVAAERRHVSRQRRLQRRRLALAARARCRDRRTTSFHAPHHIAGCPAAHVVYAHASAATAAAPCVKNRAAATTGGVAASAVCFANRCRRQRRRLRRRARAARSRRGDSWPRARHRRWVRADFPCPAPPRRSPLPARRGRAGGRAPRRRAAATA